MVSEGILGHILEEHKTTGAILNVLRYLHKTISISSPGK